MSAASPVRAQPLSRLYYAAALRRAGQLDSTERERQEVDQRLKELKRESRTNHETLEAMPSPPKPGTSRPRSSPRDCGRPPRPAARDHPRMLAIRDSSRTQ
jgi:hypothetical protein